MARGQKADVLKRLMGDALPDDPPREVSAVRAISEDEDIPRIVFVPVDAVTRDAETQPRQLFDPERLSELAASIREKGVLQPIIVRKDPEAPRERFIVISGERRLRAATEAGLTEIPALVRSPGDRREIALIENLQRENLTPLEEAEALAALKHEKGYTDEQLADVVGKKRKAINDTLRLATAPEDMKAEWRTSATWSKSQLLQVVSAGSPEKMRATWDVLKTGEAITVRALRATKKPAATKGRPKNFVHAYKASDGRFRLSITFSKSRASREEIRDALEEALGELG